MSLRPRRDEAWTSGGRRKDNDGAKPAAPDDGEARMRWLLRLNRIVQPQQRSLVVPPCHPPEPPPPPLPQPRCHRASVLRRVVVLAGPLSQAGSEKADEKHSSEQKAVESEAPAAAPEAAPAAAPNQAPEQALKGEASEGASIPVVDGTVVEQDENEIVSRKVVVCRRDSEGGEYCTVED